MGIIDRSRHPGPYIRKHVIPAGMSVKDAAGRLGVGRPALSNLLNGNSSLSADMAVRLEKAFGADKQALLNMQADVDRHLRQGEERNVAVRAYVPNFLSIKARQIEAWSENLEARSLLSVLLRKLIYSTGTDLREVDFPGYDNAERKGWDGWVCSDAVSAWIPEGKSGWEFGVNRNPAGKAESDYAARLASVSPKERAEITFVFVTPRNWHGKIEWAKSKNAANEWKAVRAFDASDLEQWLDQSIPSQVWLAEQLAIPTSGFRTLEECWREWSVASDPEMSPAIFDAAIAAHGQKFVDWLQNVSERPFVVAADFSLEALAFLSCLVRSPSVSEKFGDTAAVFSSESVLRTLAASAVPFIPIVYSDATEKEIAALYRRLHCVVVRPRNAIDSMPDIVLDTLSPKAFEDALLAMNLQGDSVEKLARESGRSPTILRRRLSKIDAIRVPAWARDGDTARNLLPMAFVGAWHSKSKADCEVIAMLANRSYQDVEVSIANFLQLDGTPVWATGQYRGVASKIDSLFAIAKFVTAKDIDDFLLVAEYVLSEADPKLDLPEDKRWAAGLYGKVRDHSAALREGVCESLVLLALHGDSLFKDRLGSDVPHLVSNLIHTLLTPLTLEKLLSHDNELPLYAEAAPDQFLRILEEDLQKQQPVVLGLLKPTDSGAFGGCPRSGLLWALECLAWKNLGRVNLILAQLSRTAINDNWTNKPIASLESIYRAWMPQTAASLEERLRAVEALVLRFPDIGWRVCVDQFSVGSQIGHQSYRPRWRRDASDSGEVVSNRIRNEFVLKVIELTIGWKTHDENTLGDLVARLQVLSDEHQVAVWDCVDAWAEAETSESAKAALREKIRRFAFTRRASRRGLKAATKARALAAGERLSPLDPVVRHAWLFADQWVEITVEDVDDKGFDYDRREKKINNQRADALKEIWSARRFEGIKELLAHSNAPHVIGQHLVSCISEKRQRVKFLRDCLSLGPDSNKAEGCIRGFLHALGDVARDEAVVNIAAVEAPDDITRLLCCAPFGNRTWRCLDQFGKGIHRAYWERVPAFWNRHDEAELIELIERLLDVKRPRAAFHAVHMDLPKVETSCLRRLMFAVGTDSEEPPNNYKLSAYDVSSALDSLDGRSGVSQADMAQLEFIFIDALDDEGHGIPNLERQVVDSPILFVQLLALLFRRTDGGEDPHDWQTKSPRQSEGLGATAYRLLGQIKNLPGIELEGEKGTDKLHRWIAEVRQLCLEHGRPEIGDQKIGEILSRVPSKEGEAWPRLVVCEVMERIASGHIARGFSVGAHNSRGAHWRAEGGEQERDLAAKYRAWARQYLYEYPYVSNVLENIATDYEREGAWHDTDAQVRKRLHR